MSANICRDRPDFSCALWQWTSKAHFGLDRAVKKEEPGVFAVGYRTFSEISNPPKRNDARTGPVLTLQPIGEAMFVGTDGRGVFRFQDDEIERLTFEGTAGGLRSDRVYAIFADREGVIWFGTDRGVSRYDPNAPRVETVGTSPDNNFVRTVFRSSNGRLFAGTNRGLFVYEENLRSWNPVHGPGSQHHLRSR